MPKRRKNPKTRDVFKSPTGQIGYFKVPMRFQEWQSTLTQSEKDVLLVFFTQMRYRGTQWIEITHELLGYWTGIKKKATITKALYGLAKHGWIGDIKYQMRDSNIYFVNLEPRVNKDLIEKIDRRRTNTSEAKKKSIEGGETGKFKKGEPK